jgi:hypothetical protein
LRRAGGDISEDTVQLKNMVEILAQNSHFNTAMCRTRSGYKTVDFRESKWSNEGRGSRVEEKERCRL